METHDNRNLKIRDTPPQGAIMIPMIFEIRTNIHIKIETLDELDRAIGIIHDLYTDLGNAQMVLQEIWMRANEKVTDDGE